MIDVIAGDVTIGGFTSPLLSWLGSAALLAFFGWQVARLFADVLRVSAPYLQLEPVLAPLAEEIESTDLGRAVRRAFSDGREAAPATTVSAGVTDIDRLTALDQAMREAGAFRRPWVQFRKTLLIEHVPWTSEPRIFSTRRAEDFFTEDAVLGGAIDLAFYRQLPSLITGFGLLLTFVAICTGLGRLHADGETVKGIQGLINGLAGKFLTSIIGLVCANVFVLVERPAVRRLLGLHEELVTLLDESFPRRTAEDLLDALARQRSAHEAVARAARGEDGEPGPPAPQTRLDESIEALTSAVHALAEQVAAAGADREVVVPLAPRQRSRRLG
ncbi:MAG: hypothetical protein HY294_08060 [Candidatus Rokubacteria bacterium]|nr:hypothetical protein [Candidatus Rokubacteria bacterium]